MAPPSSTAMKRRPHPSSFLLLPSIMCAILATSAGTARASPPRTDAAVVATTAAAAHRAVLGRRRRSFHVALPAGRGDSLQMGVGADGGVDGGCSVGGYLRRVEEFAHLVLRGGAAGHDDFDDEYDDDGCEDEDEDDDGYDLYHGEENERMPPPPRQRQQRPRRSGPPPRSRPRGPPPPGEQFQRPRSSGGRRGPPPPYHRGRPPPPRGAPRKKKRGAVSTATGLAKKTIDVSTGAAVAGLKGTGKAAFYLASPKHVSRREACGVWRFDQQVGKMPDGPFQSCAANVEFTPKGDAITKYNDETYRTPYRFVERSWPRSCTIDFDARAFQGPDDDEPVMMHYRGGFRRKMADKSVVKIVGRIYEIQRGFWKGSEGKKVQVGTFTARRRMAAAPPPPPSPRRGGTGVAKSDHRMGGDDEYDDDLYDEYDGYDSDIDGGYDEEYDEE